jgi:hypothetical protein
MATNSYHYLNLALLPEIVRYITQILYRPNGMAALKL